MTRLPPPAQVGGTARLRDWYGSTQPSRGATHSLASLVVGELLSPSDPSLRWMHGRAGLGCRQNLVDGMVPLSNRREANVGCRTSTFRVPSNSRPPANAPCPTGIHFGGAGTTGWRRAIRPAAPPHAAHRGAAGHAVAGSNGGTRLWPSSRHPGAAGRRGPQFLALGRWRPEPPAATGCEVGVARPRAGESDGARPGGVIRLGRPSPGLPYTF